LNGFLVGGVFLEVFSVLSVVGGYGFQFLVELFLVGEVL